MIYLSPIAKIAIGDPVKKRRAILIELVKQLDYKPAISRLNATAI